MAATEVTDILRQARVELKDLRARQYWSDAELLDIFKHGKVDLWGAIIDVYEEHYFIVDETNVKLVASTNKIAGVPADCFRVTLIEPRDTSSSTGSQITFRPRDYNHPLFQAARALGSSSLTSDPVEVYYHVTGVGSPVEAPSILTAPQLSSDLELRLAYIPTIPDADYNNVPGGSDHALKAWTVAFAMAKEREDKTPHPGWLAVYQTEKQNILTRIMPRQEQESQHAEGVFEFYGY